ncbi:hypothetical protein [Methylorubrum aminovorans]|uniref:hypothetical protein n=1 Tax=Methylorubrum aminovorans TaxID=269069 RepID=UPI001EDE3A0E|nr:hypothetical protein [Methylorubrum aminovorans]
MAPCLRLDGYGDFAVVDRGGSVLPGLVLSDALDDVQRSNPTLFKSAPPPGNPQGVDHSNPFASGPGHNVTAQMILWRTDPERAEYLTNEAGLKITPLR